jgi:hypothetical protein
VLNAHCRPRFSVHCVSEPFKLAEFRHGLVWGAVALGLGLLLCLALRRRGRLPVAGLLLAGAAMAGLQPTHELPGLLVVAVALLAAGGLAADFLRLPMPLRAALLIPGAALLMAVPHASDRPWIGALVFVTATVGGALVADADQWGAAAGIGPVLFAITVAVAYTTVPDLEEILPLLAAAVLMAFLAWPVPLARLGAGGAAAAVGEFAWVAAMDGRGRHTAIIGAIGCLGLLVALPLVRFIGARWRRLPLVPLALAQLVLGYWMARVAGLRRQLPLAASLAIAGMVVAVVAVRLAFRATPPAAAPE